MSMPGYGPWARLAYFRGSSEKGERVRGLIVHGLHVRVVVVDGELHGLDAARVAGGGPEVSVVPHCEVGGGGAFHDNVTGFAGDIEGIRVDQRRDTATDPELTWKKRGGT